MELPIEFRLVKIKNLYQIEYRIVDIFKTRVKSNGKPYLIIL